MQKIASVTWNALYSELMSFVYAKVGDKSLAEDIVQDVFVKVHTRRSQLKDAEKLSNWIYRIARNAVADHYRSAARSIGPVHIDWESSYNEFNDCVSHCLSVLMSTLPAKYKLTLQLAEVENLTQLEMADKLNISYSGVRSRVQRARKMLKNKLDELYSIKTDNYGNVIACENKVPCCCTRNC